MTDQIEEIIRNHFKNGEKNHYNKAHVRDILIRKGYDPIKVQMVYNMLNLEEQNQTVQREVVVDNKKILSSPVLPIIGGVVLALVLFFGISLLVPNDESGAITGYAIEDAKEKTTENLDRVITLNDKIDKKQEQILAQLRVIHEKDLTIEEKERIIKEQLEEINKIQGFLEEEQNHLRQSLLELLNTLSERPNK